MATASPPLKVSPRATLKLITAKSTLVDLAQKLYCKKAGKWTDQKEKTRNDNQTPYLIIRFGSFSIHIYPNILYVRNLVLQQYCFGLSIIIF